MIPSRNTMAAAVAVRKSDYPLIADIIAVRQRIWQHICIEYTSAMPMQACCNVALHSRQCAKNGVWGNGNEC